MTTTASGSSPHNFVVASWGSMGDVHPYLGIAKALKARGHRVSFLTNQAFEELATEAGVDFHPIGTMAEAQETLGDPNLWHARKGFEVVWRSCLPAQKLLADFIISQPLAANSVVIAHPLTMPGACIARGRISGARLIGTFLAPANLRTCHDPLWLGPTRVPRWVPLRLRRWVWEQIDAKILDPLALPGINALRRDYGLDPIQHYAELIYDAPDFAVTLFPSWFGPTMPDWPARLKNGDFLLFDAFSDQPLAQEIQDFLSAGSPPIVFTFGSAMQQGNKAFQASLEACLRLERRGIFLAVFGEQIPTNLPPTVKWFPYVPFKHLLPHAAAVVHHGGIGSSAEAMRAGVPQLVVPMAFDQFDNGARIETMGIGRCLPRNRYRANTVAEALEFLLGSESVRRNCMGVAARFADPDPAQTCCRLIEESL